MNRKEIIGELQKLYALKRLYGYRKSTNEKEYQIYTQIRFKIKLYEALIKSNYRDTLVDNERLRKYKQRIVKQKRT